MSTDAHSARDDLAFLRDIVDDDWRPGLWALGAVYLSIGVALCLHVLISWADDAGALPFRSAYAYLLLYGGFSVLWTWIGQRSRKTSIGSGPSKVGIKNRVGLAALLGAFFAHLVMLAVFVIVAVRQESGFVVELAPLVLFATQGAMWLVVHALRRVRWHLIEALGWFAATLALAPLVNTAYFGPALALVAVVLMVLPSIHMMRVARKSA